MGVKCIGQIEQYLAELENKGDRQFVVLISEKSHEKYVTLFKKVDEFILYVKNVEESMPVMRKKVIAMAREEKALDQILEQKMKIKIHWSGSTLQFAKDNEV